MKYPLFLFVGFILFSFKLKAQPLPPGATGIELTTTLSDSTLFESVQAYLENEGFSIEKADEETATVVTEYKNVYGETEIRIMARIENSVVMFTAQGTFEAKGQQFVDEPLANEGPEDESIKGGFISFNGIINRYAQTLEQATLEYTLP
ncbi:hypothetical protein [Spirosoma endophyticum]|uniref:Uncharacterized protein n=1 Tax=Spirosoma endophyticum TaxID=662367 RepID=A0A1I1FFA8_9BACT|nr:hypothetical protein [Spirosoma endophyticum]SFB97672.1 hypothetical protein SAMN05216167_101211 [Spirosoma endophyticum]